MSDGREDRLAIDAVAETLALKAVDRAGWVRRGSTSVVSDSDSPSWGLSIAGLSHHWLRTTLCPGASPPSPPHTPGAAAV